MNPLVIKGVEIGSGAPKTIVSLMDATVEGALQTAAEAVEAGVDCLEWRIDFSESLNDPEKVAEESKLLAEALPNAPLLFTFRSESQGGQRTLSEKKYVALNKAVIEAGCIDLVDIEDWISEKSIKKLVKCAKKHNVKTVISFHDFAGTPKKGAMLSRLERMRKMGADIPKIAVMAKNTSDVLDLLAATEKMARKHPDTPILTMAMGREGSISRLAGELFGSALTFCALHKASAPGQVDVQQAKRMMADLHDVVGVQEASQEASEEEGNPQDIEEETMGEPARISGHTHLITLIGNPTTHSSSPATHNLSFEHAGIDTVYLCFDVLDTADLPKVVAAMKCMEGWDGSNVTMPCKQAIVPLLDELDDAAALMGAVNVISYKDGKLKGYNTDGIGFMTNLRKHGVQDKGARMTLIGCGGAGSAILTQAALDGVSEIDVFEMPGGKGHGNALELAPKLAEAAGCKVTVLDIADKEALAASIQKSDILANATPVGMGEGSTDTPVPAELIKPGMVVADAVYFPRETQLIKNAKEKGCTTVPGLGMMIEQAAAGEAIWYGIEMDNDLIIKELFS